MSLPTIDPRPAEKLGSLVDQYLSAGGTIETLPGPSLAPLPPRRHPKPQPKKPRRPLMPAHIKRYRESYPKIIELFERGLPLKHIGIEVGRTCNFVISCLDYYGIDARAVRAEQKEQALAETIEQIRIMAKDGHSGAYIAAQLGITDSGVRYHADRHEIRFLKG